MGIPKIKVHIVEVRTNNTSVFPLLCAYLFMEEVTIVVIETNLKVSCRLDNFTGN